MTILLRLLAIWGVVGVESFLLLAGEVRNNNNNVFGRTSRRRNGKRRISTPTRISSSSLFERRLRLQQLVEGSIVSADDNGRNGGPNKKNAAPTTNAGEATSSTTTTSAGVDDDNNNHDNDDNNKNVDGVRFIAPLLEYGYRTAVEELYEDDDKSETSALGERASGQPRQQRKKKKPLLLYLPGFDGTYLSPFLQFPELGTAFDVRCMTVAVDDRSTYEALKRKVLEYLARETTSENENNDDAATAPATTVIRPQNEQQQRRRRKQANKGQPQRPRRPVYLAGESFGGILVSDVALTLLENGGRGDTPSSAGNNNNNIDVDVGSIDLKGLALINAATCYDRSRLAAEAPAIAELHPCLYPFGLLKLLPLFADEYSFRQLLLILQAKALPSVIDTAEREAYLGRVALSLPFVVPYLTQDAMKWRLGEWLERGCAKMARRLPEFDKHPDCPVLIVAAERDGVLPSIAEAERLASLLPNTMLHVVEGAGHASTCGSRVDLAALFRKCFRELRHGRRRGGGGSGGGRWYHRGGSSTSNNTTDDATSVAAQQQRLVDSDRTEMKPVAAAGVGEYFGMEPRYDNASIGLNPLFYWSKKYYRKYKPPVPTVLLEKEGDHENVTAIT